ncbi:VHS-domain-containing protein [Acaromyces ingoldii]|uniref:VHS-domain-containing protein n=1 Tax=Acaromyces ingoldii TaxID=215250 RepID=A0A316YHK6_9BASI|nr:VHS-domain-containing protein [Acaromyces ingoldii]PWN88098.1 VHS-domain-containing protein [Acaromyces ingoldii]
MYNHQQRAMGSPSGAGGRPRGALSSSNSSSAAGAIGAWADWAARSLDPDIPQSAVQAHVERCCNPSLREPNLGLNLELADYIKQKQANTPREAAVEVVRKINSRHPHVSILALHLLDHLVKNCGYPFHLQVATKEFLNELVKRFPERPPVFPSPSQQKILELIQEWKTTICVTSKHREDLVHIRDMHRLLGYKGYRFPNVDSRAAGVMNSENSLQSPEELEEEDRAAQGAKLQELIRRGTPRDLAQAQELMKVMSGAEPENKPDYWAQTKKDLDKVQSRAILLNNMLDNRNEGETFAKGDAYDQIASHLRSVQPRLQKWIGEAEEGEAEHLDRLLLINDLINQVCERHKAYSKGDFSVTVTIDPSIDPKKGGADAVPTAKITDLISFDDEDDSSKAAAPGGGSSSASVLDDFASLTFGDAPSAASASASSTTAAGNGTATAPGGLPSDLFDASNTSRPASTTSSQLGGWGALQLPMASGGPSSVPNSSGASTPAPQGQKPQAGSGKGNSSSNGNGKGAGASAGGSDPFADLSKW